MKISTIRINKYIKALLIAIFWISIWAIVSKMLNNELILPTPKSATLALFDMIFKANFYANVLATMYRVILGIVLSLFAGFVSALLAYYIPLLRELLKPFISIIKTTPVLAVIIFALLWLTSGNVPIFVCFLMCYPIIYTNLLMGLEHTDHDYLEMAKVFKVSRKKQICLIYIPSVMPYLKSGLSLVCGISWKTVVASEVLSSPQFSMGYQMWDAKVYLETDQLFAWIIAIVLLSIIFEQIMRYIISGKALKDIRHHDRREKRK